MTSDEVHDGVTVAGGENTDVTVVTSMVSLNRAQIGASSATSIVPFGGDVSTTEGGVGIGSTSSAACGIGCVTSTPSHRWDRTRASGYRETFTRPMRSDVTRYATLHVSLMSTRLTFHCRTVRSGRTVRKDGFRGLPVAGFTNGGRTVRYAGTTSSTIGTSSARFGSSAAVRIVRRWMSS